MKTQKPRKPTNHSGSTFDKFLEEEGIKEEVEAVALKRVTEAKPKRAQPENLAARQSTPLRNIPSRPILARATATHHALNLHLSPTQRNRSR